MPIASAGVARWRTAPGSLSSTGSSPTHAKVPVWSIAWARRSAKLVEAIWAEDRKTPAVRLTSA
jgi:hypothetical protein